MQNYFAGILAAVSVTLLLRLLMPEGSGPEKHLKLLTALFLLLSILSPAKGMIEGLLAWEGGNAPLPDGWESEQDPEATLNESLQNAEKTYFAECLVQAVSEEFELSPGTLRVSVKWSYDASPLRPEKITFILSGNSIWKDPHAICDYASKLLNCPCDAAIE